MKEETKEGGFFSLLCQHDRRKNIRYDNVACSLKNSKKDMISQLCNWAWCER